VRLLLDEMLSPAIARELRDRGHDVLAIADHPGWVALSDPEVMALAQTERRAVVKDGRTRKQGHASSRRVTRHTGHWMFHARHCQPLENLRVLASVDDLPWPGQVSGPLSCTAEMPLRPDCEGA